MKRKMLKMKRILACALTAVFFSSSIPVLSAQEPVSAQISVKDASAVHYYAEFHYKNDDSEEIKYNNAKITDDEAKKAQQEHDTVVTELGYIPGMVLVSYDRAKAAEKAIKLGLNSEWELYKQDLKSQGDNSITSNFITDDTITFSINIHYSKLVMTAVTEYQKLEGVQSAEPNHFIQADHPEPYNPEFRYQNEDDEDIKNKNITEEEAQAAAKERQIYHYYLGYLHDEVLVSYNRPKVKAQAKQLGLDSEWDVYKNDIRNQGDDAIQFYSVNGDEISFLININDNRTVPTAIEEYKKLDYVQTAGVRSYASFGEPPANFEVDGIYPVYNNDSISLGCVHQNTCKYTQYRWEYCKIGENKWHLISDWNSSEWCTWYPDANEDYAVVCKVAYFGSGVVWKEAVWYVSRPQMKKQVTGRCALPDKDGILFGCTSTVGNNDAGYLTTCYIWSFDRQEWITQSAYEASNCAWFKSSALPKGNYMMYNCTERRMPDGTRRKLSCDYYLYRI